MKFFDPKKKLAVLRALRNAARPLGGARVARELQAFGLNLKPRTLRLYLEHLEDEGLVESAGQRGRQVTARGIEELKRGSVTDRVGFTAARVDALAYQTTFRLATCSGRIVVNASIVNESDLPMVMAAMGEVLGASLGMGKYVSITAAGQMLGDLQAGVGRVIVATVCSVTINAILLGAGIPVVSRFGGVLELEQGRPARFTDVIHYDGTSLDPLEIFIKGRLTSVTQAARTGNGRIGASFREIPTAAVPEVERIARRLDRIGLNGILMLGRRNQPLLEFPVQEGRTGMIVAGGLNAIAAVEEAGIPVTSYAMHSLVDFDCLVPFDRIAASGVVQGP